MRNLTTTTALLALFPLVPASAEPAAGFGLSFSFGANKETSTGVSLRVFSDDASKSFVAMGGVTYYFNGKNLGLDAGVAYNGENDLSTGLSYDFLNKAPVVSMTFVDLC